MSEKSDRAQSDSPSPGPDQLIDLVNHPVRRHLLREVVEEEVASFDDLVDAARHAGLGPSRHELEITLHHVHLSKLEESGLLAVDRDRETVRYRSNDDVERLLDVLAVIERE